MIRYILLGVVQGLTEFLPVSSSGHLVILQNIFGFNGQELKLAIILHFATALALIVFFLKDIIIVLRDKRLLVFIAIVTLVTGTIGIAGRNFFSGLFSSVRVVSVSLVATGIILFLTKRATIKADKKTGISDALALGIFQAVAIIPGISRSGLTIATLLFRGFDRQRAFKLSFLAAIPVILLVALLEFNDCSCYIFNSFGLLISFFCAFITGLCSLYILKKLIIWGKLHYFGFYCFAIGIITMFF